MKKIAVTLFVLAALTLGVLGARAAWPASGSGDPGQSDLRQASPEQITAETLPEDRAVNERREALHTPASSSRALRVECRFGVDGPPAAGVLVDVSPQLAGSLLARSARTNAQGVAVELDLPARKVRVTADRGGAVNAILGDQGTTSVVLEIPPGIDVHGRVVDGAGAPIAGAGVWLSTAKRSYCDGQDVATADASGRFFLRSVEPDRFLSAHAPGLRAAVVQPVHGAPGSEIHVDLVLEGVGSSLAGIVMGPDDEPAAGAPLLLGDRADHFAWQAERF
jgi:hypothetical protein